MSFKGFVLSLIIVLCGVFIYLKVQSLGDENSHFNRTTRYELGKYKIMRAILALRNDGDARAEYFSGDTPIIVEVVQPHGIDIDHEALAGFRARVTEYTGRPTELFLTDRIANGALSEEALQEIVSGNRRRSGLGTPNLFIIYAEDFESAGEEVGRTYQEFGILLSHSRISNLTSNYPSARRQYIESTLLHEFGHQIGLQHVSDPNCIMNSFVENPRRVPSFGGNYTTVQFCNEELNALKTLQQQWSN